MGNPDKSRRLVTHPAEDDDVRAREIREKTGITVAFRGLGTELKGNVARDDVEPSRRKIVFIEGLKGGRATGPTPQDGETWICQVMRDTNPDDGYRGALIVRALRKVEGATSVSSAQLENWLREEWNAAEPQGWVESLGTYLSKAGVTGGQVLLGGDKVLYVVKGDKVRTCSPYYFESERGGSSPCKWGIKEIESAPENAPPEVLRVLRPKMEARAAEDQQRRDEEERLRTLARENRPRLEHRLQELSSRLAAIALVSH